MSKVGLGSIYYLELSSEMMEALKPLYLFAGF